jgi:hypothetical protein
MTSRPATPVEETPPKQPPVRLWKPGEEPTGEEWVRLCRDMLRRQMEWQRGKSQRGSDPEHNFRAQGIRVI